MSAADDSFQRGMEVRREVLGDAYVERAIGNASPLDARFQEWLTRSAWGSVWSDPTLDRRSRSLVTIAILAALRSDELEIHLRGALNNGATPEEVAEVLMHVGVYAGIPAANTAFRVAKRVYVDDRAVGDRGD